MSLMAFSSTFMSLLSIAAIAQGFPMSDDGDLLSRTIGETVTGALASISTKGSGAKTSTYTLYKGDGTSWPDESKWIGSFETMFSNNKEIMSTSCSQFSVANDSPAEIEAIHSGILAASKASSVDPRFILATIMQESGGCVRVPSTNAGVQNPGLMQDHAGAANCIGVNPCPTDKIHTMISEGTAGTAAGDGLANCLKEAAPATGARAFYVAARIYNTGSYVAGSNLETPKYGTSCYASDVANRLMGWVGLQTGCTLKNP